MYYTKEKIKSDKHASLASGDGDNLMLSSLNVNVSTSFLSRLTSSSKRIESVSTSTYISYWESRLRDFQDSM